MDIVMTAVALCTLVLACVGFTFGPDLVELFVEWLEECETDSQETEK